MNQDEASRGYDAWSLVETGADRHGLRWPLFTKSFGEGDYPPALTIYPTSLFTAVLGPTVQAIRLPGALLSLLTVFVLYSWLRRQIGTQGALIAAGILATDPWHIALSRTAVEGAFAPILLATAMLGLSRAGLLPTATPIVNDPVAPQVTTIDDPSRHRTVWAVLAGVMFAFHAWVYSATRLFTPLFCTAIILFFAAHYARLLKNRTGRKVLAAVAIGLVIGGWPIWWTALQNPERLAARAHATLIDFKGVSISAVMLQLWQNFLPYIDPRPWFLSGRDIVGTPLPGLGQHLWVAAPLILLGLATAFLHLRKSPWHKLLVAWFFLAPLPAIICKDDHPHATRIVGGMLLWATLAGMGGASLWSTLRRWTIPRRRVVTAIAALAIVGNIAYFAQRYFQAYPPLAEPNFQTSLVKAIRFAAGQSQSADFILVTGRANEPYIYILLFQPIPPRTLAAQRFVSTPAPANFHQVPRVGKWFFAPTAADEFPEARGRFEEEWSTLRPDAVGLIVITAGLFNGGELLAKYGGDRVGEENDAFEVRRVSLASLKSAGGS